MKYQEDAWVQTQLDRIRIAYAKIYLWIQNQPWTWWKPVTAHFYMWRICWGYMKVCDPHLSTTMTQKKKKLETVLNLKNAE